MIAVPWMSLPTLYANMLFVALVIESAPKRTVVEGAPLLAIIVGERHGGLPLLVSHLGVAIATRLRSGWNHFHYTLGSP